LEILCRQTIVGGFSLKTADFAPLFSMLELDLSQEAQDLPISVSLL